MWDSPELIHLTAGSFYLLTYIFQFLPLPSPRQRLFSPDFMSSTFLDSVCKSICLSLSHISLSIVPSRSADVVAKAGLSSFLWLNNLSLCVYISCPPHGFFRSFVDIYLSFHVSATVNNAAVNMWVQISFEIASLFFWIYCIPWSGIAGFYNSNIFNILKNLYIVLHSGCTNLHSRQQCKGSLSPTSSLFDHSHLNRCGELQSMGSQSETWLSDWTAALTDVRWCCDHPLYNSILGVPCLSSG